MLGRQIFKSHFGKHYKIHFSKDGPVPRSLRPERFSSLHSAQQFLRGLQTPQSYWHKLAAYCDDAAPFRSHQRDHFYVVGHNILSGRIRVYEVDLPDTHALARSVTAIQDRQGYQYQFVTMRQAIASSHSPQGFTSSQQVYETLYELAPNLEQLQVLATDLQLAASPEQQTYTQLMDALAEGFAEQRVALYVTAPFKRPEMVGAALDSAANMPGNRKVDLAPATPVARPESNAVQNKKAPDKINSAMDFVGDVENHEVGRLGGELYSPKKLSLLKEYLSRRGIELRVGDEHVPFGKAGGFNAAEGFLILRDNPTNYEVWHELSHFRQYQKLGKKAYLDLPRTKDFNAPEQYVFDMLENSPKRWNSLNFDEQQHAIRYIENVGGFR